ncbi:stage II sporulation protein M [uncultured Parasphingopyxis sp.]|uniref:stage II sporulation protein M n=1 Tax=uncultured Parasphingopyxis sp. TaxID=1547918 RepID=UPI00262AF7F9|nr:stage II sporulation protein M [uncultured Parasphingopyxis sp.]
MRRIENQAIFSSRNFRAEREEDWQRLEALLKRAEGGSVRRLSDADLVELPVLYRSALSSLSVARETTLDQSLINYLEGLCTRAYFFVYGVRTSLGSRLASFFARDWPAAVRGLWLETLMSFALLLAGIVTAYLLVMNDPAWFDAILPADLANGRDMSASAEDLRSTLYTPDQDALAVFATYLFTHNAQISIFAFALGFAFGVPTALLLVYNGAVAGAFIALFVDRGLGFEMGGWLLIHGTTEFFAIVLAGAAGLRIGTRVVFPGAQSRLAAARESGKTAACAMVGVVVMLLAAGLLEGFGRQLITHDLTRYGIAATMFLLWCAYFYLPGLVRGQR